MHSFQNFIVRLIPNHPPPLETRIWKLVVRALTKCNMFADDTQLDRSSLDVNIVTNALNNDFKKCLTGCQQIN